MITADSLRFRRSGRIVLDGVTLALPPGRVVAAVGPNGAGKSTLLKLLAGELAPEGGTVFHAGRPLRTLTPAALARLRAVMPQSTSLDFDLTVHEIVRLGAEAGGARDPDRAAGETLGHLGLSAWSGRPVTALSGGERQRVAFARALAQLPEPLGPDGPRTLLLDEPTASLDLSRQLDLLERARAFARAGGAVFAVLHDLNLAAEFADELLVLAAGRLQAVGPPTPALFESIVRDVYAIPGAATLLPADGMAYVLPQARVR